MKTEKRSPLKDKPLRYAGQSLDEQIEEKISEALYWFLVSCGSIIVAIVEWARYLDPQPTPPISISVFTVIILVIGVYKIFKTRKEVKRLAMARDGEKLVAEGLQEMLKQGATVLHDIQGDKFNIDHAVVSKNGIYLIETKTFSKPILKKDAKISFDSEQVFADGFLLDRNPIQQAKALAKWLQDLLIQSTGIKFAVRPVVLFPGWFVEPMNRGQDVWILNPKALPTFIANEPEKLKETEVHLVAFHLSRYVRTFTPKQEQ